MLAGHLLKSRKVMCPEPLIRFVGCVEAMIHKDSQAFRSFYGHFIGENFDLQTTEAHILSQLVVLLTVDPKGFRTLPQNRWVSLELQTWMHHAILDL